ncbi:MAG: hypothetical protein VKP57_08000 [Candidatus Sericytochromatia bacterium]|nr:hypothetical protein [Candidatus Sericytochromatia bacterium]
MREHLTDWLHRTEAVSNEPDGDPSASLPVAPDLEADANLDPMPLERALNLQLLSGTGMHLDMPGSPPGSGRHASARLSVRRIKVTHQDGRLLVTPVLRIQSAAGGVGA